MLWLAPLVLLAPVILTGRAIFWGTPLLQFIPWWTAAAQMLGSGHLPLWNPLVGMGAPLLANYQSALLYPPTWTTLLAYAVAGVGGAAWWASVLLALHLAWAAWGMARLVARLGLSSLAQIVAGLAYGLSGYLVARAGFLSINAAAAWIPWVLLFAMPGSARLLISPASPTASSPPRPNAGLSLPLTACLAMLLLAGHAQTAWYAILLTGVWSAYWALRLKPLPGWRSAARSLSTAWLALAAAGLLAAGVSAAQLLPTAELLSLSQRAGAVDYKFAMTYSFWPWRLVTLFAPTFFGSPVQGDYWGYGNFWEDALYIGLLPLLLALGTLRRLMRRQPVPGDVPAGLVAFLWAIFGVALLFGLGDNTPVFPWLYRHVPTFAMFQAPTRWLIWGEIALALLAALGVHAWRRPTGRALYWTRLAVMGGVAVMLGAGLAWSSLGDVSPSFLRATALMGLWGVGTGLLSLAAPPDERAAPAPPPTQKVRIAALEGLETRLRDVTARWAQRLSSGNAGYPLHRWHTAVVAWVALDLLVAGWGLNPAAPLSLYTRPAANASALADLSQGSRLFMPPGDEYFFKYVRFLRFDTFDPGQDWADLRLAQLADANLLDGFALLNNFDPMLPGRYTAWLDALEQQPRPVQADWLRRADVGVQLEVYRTAPKGLRLRPIANPARWWWADCAQSALDAAAARQALLSRPLHGPLILEGPALPPCSSVASSPAPLIQPLDSGYDLRNPSYAAAVVETTRPGWLVLADVWYPGWQARIDGVPVPMLHADLAFRAVHVEAGRHTVEYLYWPVPFYLGAGLSLASLALAGVLWRRRSRTHDEN
jgi:hypothetical protein